MNTGMHNQVLVVAREHEGGPVDGGQELRDLYFGYSQEDVDATSRFDKGWPQAEVKFNSSRVAA